MEKNEKWLQGSLAKHLKEAFPSTDYIMLDKDCYYMLYDIDLKVYNELPNDDDNHNLVFFKYYKENYTLEIIDYTYNRNLEE